MLLPRYILQLLVGISRFLTFVYRSRVTLELLLGGSKVLFYRYQYSDPYNL